MDIFQIDFYNMDDDYDEEDDYEGYDDGGSNPKKENNTITDGGVAPRCSFAGPT